MTKLKPCPFCGSTKVKEYIQPPRIRQRVGRKEYYQVFICCQDCNAHGPMILLEDIDIKDKVKETRDKAIELWNNRVGG